MDSLFLTLPHKSVSKKVKWSKLLFNVSTKVTSWKRMLRCSAILRVSTSFCSLVIHFFWIVSIAFDYPSRPNGSRYLNCALPGPYPHTCLAWVSLRWASAPANWVMGTHMLSHHGKTTTHQRQYTSEDRGTKPRSKSIIVFLLNSSFSLRFRYGVFSVMPW